MQITVQRVSPVLLELQVEVPADTVRNEVDKAYNNLARKAHVKGFRPGKAPRNVLTQLYGPQVQNDVANAIVNTTLPKALTEKNVTPVSQPQVEAGRVAPTEAFTYKARFEVQPDIEDVKYEGFELVRPPSAVEDKMVDEQLQGLRLRHATLKTPEPARPAQKGDVLTIDYTIDLEGKDVKDAAAQGVQLELGSGQLLPELDAALMERNVGDKVNVEATLPEQHQRPDFRGKKVTFKVQVTDAKERILPELDDEFAKDVGQFQTLVELRADIHSRLEKMMKDRSETALAEQIVVKLNEANPCDVPPSLVEQQRRMMEQELAMQARRMGQQITRQQFAGIAEKMREDAEKKVRAGLLMAAIARKHEMKVTEEDIEKGLGELAQETGKNVAKLRAEYRDKGKRDILIGMILEDKILDFLEGKSKITEGPLPSAEAAAAAPASP
ncbi:MAG TPA: trigger factor [Polyangiaceae bacterium]|jgi:trigger factor